MVSFIIDTGSDDPVLSAYDTARLGLSAAELPGGPELVGVTGSSTTRRANVILRADGLSLPAELLVLDDVSPAHPSPFPSLLGRDVLARFALFMEQATERVYLVDPDEATQLALP